MDQLKVILKCLGTQDHQDLSFISEENTLTYVNESQVVEKKIKYT